MTMFILVGAIIIMIASATFIEKWQGADFARAVIYHHPITIALWLLLILNTLFIAHSRRWIERRAWGTITLHLAFIVTLCGAFVTHTMSYEGMLHLREGATSNIITTKDGVRELPFSVKLIDFKLERYGGSQMPSSYSSEVEISLEGEALRRVTIAVNKFYDIGGFRLFQSSYDRDEMGSVLSVNYDRAGMIITYFGYLLMALGIVLITLQRGSHLRALSRELKALSVNRMAMLILTLSCGIGSLSAANTIPPEHAEKVGRLMIQNPSGRIEPVDSYSAKLLRKISKRSSFEGYSAVEVVWGFIFNPDYWCNAKIISKKGGRVSFNELFDMEGNYLLADDILAAAAKEELAKNSTDKELLKLDERVRIIYSLLSGESLQLLPLPGDERGRWFSIDSDFTEFRGDDSLFASKIIPWYTESIFGASVSGDWSEADEIAQMIETYQRKRSSVAVPSLKQIEVEILSNKIDPFFIAMIGYIVAALGLFISTFMPRLAWFRGSAQLLLLLSFALQTAGIAARWYISNQMPWASSYETMIHIGWAAALAALILARGSQLSSAIAALFGGVILFVAALNWLDPEITPLVPVLQSPWLMIHVAAITSAYGLMGISALIGVVGVALALVKREDMVLLRELRLVSEITLHVATYFMIVGIFIGAIWANESWGRYWGWDPKETWALITMILYAMILHLRLTPYLRDDVAHFALSVVAFSSVLMTYFGVNFYLTGLHAYASGQMPSSIYAVYIFYALFIPTAIFARRKVKRK